MAALLPSIILVVVGLGIAVCAWLFREGKIKRNYLLGIRTPSLMASDAAWYAGHRAAAPWLLAAGSVAVVAGIASMYVDSSASGAVQFAGLVLMLLAVIAGTVVAVRTVKRRGLGTGNPAHR